MKMLSTTLRNIVKINNVPQPAAMHSHWDNFDRHSRMPYICILLIQTETIDDGATVGVPTENPDARQAPLP